MPSHPPSNCQRGSPHSASPNNQIKSPAQGEALSVKEISRSTPTQTRESSDTPMLSAFCRVAPSERFSVLAMRAACVFFRASAFKVRTCSGVHARRFVAFLAIKQTPDFEKGGHHVAPQANNNNQQSPGVWISCISWFLIRCGMRYSLFGLAKGYH